MFYTYILRSIPKPDRLYVGYTTDLRARLKRHNEMGSTHTAKFAPWGIAFYAGFASEALARNFESYLKTHSGRMLLRKRLLA